MLNIKYVYTYKMILKFVSYMQNLMWILDSSMFISQIHSDQLVCAFALRISLLREMIGGGKEVPAAATGSSQPLEWKFAQVFSERTAREEVQEDSISNSDFEFIDLILIYLFI